MTHLTRLQPAPASLASRTPRLALRRDGGGSGARAGRCSARLAWGMGLGEMLLTLAGITAVLGVLMMVSNTVRAENADSQTKGILRQLNNAVTRYHAITQQYPPGPASVAIHYLQRLPESESHLRGLNMRADRDGFMTLFDGYGRPLNYNGADTRSRPGNFISPGPDGLFGDLKSPNPRMQQAVIDNIHSSDIPASTP